MERRKLIFLFSGILFVILVALEIIAFYLLRRKDVGLDPDPSSIKRNQNINVVLSSYFGNNWQIVLTTFLLTVLFIMGLFFIISKKNIVIDGESKTYKAANISAVVFFVILSLAVLAASYKMYADMKSNAASESDNSQIINKQKRELIQLFALISGLLVLILVLIGGGLWGYRKLKKTLGK